MSGLDAPHLASRAANHPPLSPLDFLDRAVAQHPDRAAVVWRDRRLSYAELGAMVARLAGFLTAQGVRAGDVVSVMLPNRPEMLAAHYAVPLLGAVLNAVNTRLDADTVGYILTHCCSRLMLACPATATTATAAARTAGVPCHVLDTDGGPDLFSGPATLPADLLAQVRDEWQPLAVNYTSGTTGRPKGVVYTHRGAYLNALGNVLTLGLTGRSVYLWTLPMFHCNGWCHTWAVTAAGGVHLCLDRVDPAEILAALATQGVTHMACAPVVLYMLLNHPDCVGFVPRGPVTVASGGAAPSVALIAGLEAMGLSFLHLYGLTESYGKDVPDYGFIMGVPGRLKGWMSRHGHLLKFCDAGRATCPESGFEYELRNGAVRCLTLDEEVPLPDELSRGAKSYDDFKQ